MNRLVLNGDKTGLLLVNRPALNHYKQEIYLVEQPKNVKPSSQIRILGWHINERMNYDTTMNRNIGIVQSKINKFKEFQEILDQKKLLMIANSQLLPQITYGLALVVGQNENVIESYHKCYMRVVRWVKKSYCFKQSITSLCNSLGWDSPRMSINKSAAKFARNVIHNNKPEQVLEYLRLPRTRAVAKIGRRFTINTKSARKSLISQSVDIYNVLPDQLKVQDTRDFKKMIKIYKFVFKPD